MKNADENISEEDIQRMQEYFDENIWKNMKMKTKDMTKKESLFFAFFTGAELIRNSFSEKLEKGLEKEFKEIGDDLSKMSGEEIKKMMGGRGL